MSETRDSIYYIVQSDPIAIVGFLLIGCAGLIYFRLYTKLDKIGETSFKNVSFPIVLWFSIADTYLKRARTNGWRRSVAYAAWCCLVGGILMLVLGLFRL